MPASASLPISRPAEGEFLPFYARYVARVPEGDINAILAEQAGETLALLRSVPADRSLHRYAPGKWSVRDLVQHVADTERVMAYRLLRIARGDSTPLAGFSEEDWAQVAGADRRDWLELVEEFEAVRAATIALLRGIDADAARRHGTANGATVTVRALAYIIAGHELHHVAILRERYL